MTWWLLDEYDEQVRNISPSSPAHNQKISDILKELCIKNSLRFDKALELCTVIITRNKLQNKEIVNKNIIKLDAIFEANTYNNIAAFKEVYYNCICNRDTSFVEKYIEEHTVRANYHYDLCSKCNPNSKITFPPTRVPKVTKETVRAIFCLYSLTGNDGSSQFTTVNLEKAFSPTHANENTCNIFELPRIIIFQKIKQVLTEKMFYSVSESDTSLFCHDQYGLAIVSDWQIILYSKKTNVVRDQLLENFTCTFGTKFTDFMGYDMSYFTSMIKQDSSEYIASTFEETFIYDESSLVVRPVASPASDYFEFLESPPNDNPREVTEQLINQQFENGGLKFPKSFHHFNIDDGRFKSLVFSLKLLVSCVRWDLQYHLSVLNRYVDTPNTVAYISIVYIFRYIFSTRQFSPKYVPLRTDSYLKIEMFTSGSFNRKTAMCAYSGFFIQISQSYWHSETKRIANIGDSSFMSSLTAAYDAVKYVVLHQSILKVLENYSSKKITYFLHIQDDALYMNLRGDTDSILNDICKNQLDTLILWIETYSICVHYKSKSENPASILTESASSARDRFVGPVSVDDAYKVSTDVGEWSDY